MHSHARGEVMIPKIANEQLEKLVREKSVTVVNETEFFRKNVRLKWKYVKD